MLGLCGAAVIYAVAEDDPGGALGYRIVEGTVYRVDPGDSRAYRGQIERFGGKQAVLFDQFTRWFEGLWRGKALAGTLAWISVFVSLGLCLFARYISPGAR